MLISTIDLYRLGGKVLGGEKLGTAGNLECFGPTSQGIKNYIRVELFRNGQSIDPTYHLIDCLLFIFFLNFIKKIILKLRYVCWTIM